MTPVTTCPLLQHELQPGSVSKQAGVDRVRIDCPICGTYESTGTALEMLPRLSEKNRRAFSFYVRECKEQGIKAMVLDSINIKKDLSSRFPPLPIEEKVRRFLLAIEKQAPSPGDKFLLRDKMLKEYVPVVQASSDQEVAFLREYLLSSGLIRPSASGRDERLITVQGWQRIEREHTTSRSRQAFVAMWFDDKMDLIYDTAIAPAISDAGYAPFRTKGDPSNERVDARIEVEIRKSLFLVADFTDHRGSVYYEAGFARALGKQVIWLCPKDQIHDLRFDTRQFAHIPWEWNKLEALRQKLKFWIQATVTPKIEMATK